MLETLKGCHTEQDRLAIFAILIVVIALLVVSYYLSSDSIYDDVAWLSRTLFRCCCGRYGCLPYDITRIRSYSLDESVTKATFLTRN